MRRATDNDRGPAYAPRGERWFLLACLGVTLVWYSLLERVVRHAPLDLDPFHPALLGTAFNSMARHLLAGRFDIDPAAIGFEAFQVGDRTIAYFGIFCALLRLPLVLLDRGSQLDVTRLSCLAAVCLGAWFQLRAVLLLRRTLKPSPRRAWLSGALILCILLGGQQVQFPRPTIYQEVIDWAGAQAMGFVFLAVRGLVGPDGFDRRTLSGMAIWAGLALLTRVSFGVGLYAALGLLLLVRRRDLLRPVLILLLFAMVAGVVNVGRWGDPFTFADFTAYAMNQDVTPDRLGRLAAYGAFNPRRLGLGLSYYFLPIWGIVRADGQLLFAEAQTALVDVMELPPSSFLLTDPLLMGLAAIGVAAALGPFVARGGTWAQGPPLALLAGLAVPPALMLCAISMAYRYRMEFFPLLVLAALLGVRHLCRADAPRDVTWRARGALIVAVAVSIVASHAMGALYAVSPWGPAEQYLVRDGWLATYGPRLRRGTD